MSDIIVRYCYWLNIDFEDSDWDIDGEGEGWGLGIGHGCASGGMYGSGDSFMSVDGEDKL